MSDPTNRSLADMIASLERSEAEIAAGHCVPLEPFLDRLRASIVRMEERRAVQTPQARKA